MRPRNVSLSRALDLVREAVDGVRLLADQLVDLPLAEGEGPSALPCAIEGALALIDRYLDGVYAAVRGEVDPAGIWDPRIDAGETYDDEPDVVLHAWSVKDTIANAKRELRRARRERRFRREQKAEEKGT